MPIRVYHELVLIAEDVETTVEGTVRSFSVRVFDSPVGQGTKKEQVTVPADLGRQVRWLAGRNLDQDLQKQIELGESLAALLFPSYARQMFQASIGGLRDQEGLRLRLRISSELGVFPWECLYIADVQGARDATGFLALDPRLSIVRHEGLDIPADRFDADWFEAPARRRVLVGMASPRPYDHYRKLEKLPREQRAIREALRTLEGIDAVYLPEYSDGEVAAIPGITIQQLAMALTLRSDVFHFSGHGEFVVGTAASEAALIFADDRNQAFQASSEKLGALLRGKGVRLAVLGACETGRRNGNEALTGVVPSLLRAGIPAIVAMQFTVDDELAAAFSGALYQALVAGLTVDEAAVLGRLAMRAVASGDKAQVRDWAAPVLYLRAPGGRIFNPVQEAHTARAAEQASAQLFSQQVGRIGPPGRLIGPVVGTMSSGDVEVVQRIKEDVQGFVLGARVFNFQGGQLTVRQEAQDVTGSLTAAVIDNIGGGWVSPQTGSTPNPVEELQKLLRVV